jgi:hypothetical protein
MDILSKIRAWTYRRQLLEEGATTVSDTLRHTIGVYSSHPSAPLSLWARTNTFSPEAFRELEATKAAVRIPAWRGSIFLMESQGARLAMAFHEPVKMGAAWYKSISITENELPMLREQVIAAATTPMLPKELREATGGQADKIASIARHAAHEGHILRIGSASLRSNSLKYVSTAAWLPDLLEPINRDEAWREIARRYFTIYGPARVEDFRWWLGAKKAKAEQVVAELKTTDMGNGLLLLREDVAEFEKTKPLQGDAITILPKWDTYTMGLAGDGRARLIAPEVQSRGYTSVGDGLGLVLVAGKAVATWHHNFSGSKMRVELDIFDEAIHPMMKKVEAKFEEIATVLDGKSCEVTLATEPLSPRLSVLRKRHATEE